MNQYKAMAIKAFQGASTVVEGAENFEILILNELNGAARDLPDAAFRMWAFVMSSPDKFGPDHWNTDIFRQELGFSAAKVSKAAQDLIKRGYLRRELTNEPGRLGRSSRWYFQTHEEVSHLANELDPTQMTSA